MFMESIEEFNHGKKNMTLTYETIENLYVSPAVKREIWQTLKILKEIQKVMGGEPKRVFIEMAREHQESKRTDSRKSWLMDLYKACKKEERDWLEELGQYESHQLRSDKLFLYYTQKGKCIVRNDEVAWKSGNHGTMEIVEQTMKKNNILVTRRIYEVKGGLFDQQIMKKGKGQIPIKGGDERLKNIYKYGGYNKASGAYFMLVKSLDKKNNEQRTLEFLPIYMKDYVEQSEEKAQEYLVTNRKLKNPEIILPKVKIDTLFKVDGFYMWLSGRTENRLIFKCANL